mgnify:CR=1 FL=1
MFLGNFLFILLLVALNGFFVSVEFAVVASRRSRLELMAEPGNKSAQMVKRWLENPAERDRLIAAAQLGITIVSLALGAVGENTFQVLLEPYFNDLHLAPVLQFLEPALAALPLVFSLIIVTSLHVVLGEQVPKVASLSAPEAVAILFAKPMKIFSTIFKWFVDLLDGATRLILRAFGLESGGEHIVMYTVDELKQIVTESEEGGVIETPEREMLHAIFDFSNTLVRQVMNPRTEVIALEADTSLEASISLAIESTFSKFPVYQDDLDNIIGVVHIRDLLRAQQDPNRKTSTARTLAREALFVPESLPLKDVLQQLRKRRQHVAIVIDEFGGTAGVVTLEDIMEEIVGEVSDPFDSPHPEIQIQADGTVIIEGLALIEEVNEKLGLTLFAPDYDTIAGYILSCLNRMPEMGDEVDIGSGICLKVIKMDGMRIAQLSLKRIAKPSPSDS